MIKIDLSKGLVDLAGSPVQVVGSDKQPRAKTIGEWTGDILCSANDQRLKKHGIAMRLYENKPIEVDGVDYELIYDTVDKSQYINLIAAPILHELKRCKAASQQGEKK